MAKRKTPPMKTLIPIPATIPMTTPIPPPISCLILLLSLTRPPALSRRRTTINLSLPLMPERAAGKRMKMAKCRSDFPYKNSSQGIYALAAVLSNL